MLKIASELVPGFIHPMREKIRVKTRHDKHIATATPTQIHSLVDADAIEGVLNRKRELDHVVLTVSEREARRIMGTAKGSRHSGQMPIAEDNRTVFRDGRTFFHHQAHCAAYGGMLA